MNAPVSAPTLCAHCGLPVPTALLPEEAGAPAFCCHGCASVHALLGAEGLGAYYDLARRLEATPQPARVTDRSYAEFDEPNFQSRHLRETPGGELAGALFLEGVHCAACVWLVEQLPRMVPGVTEARLDLARGGISQSFTTLNALEPHERIVLTLKDGPFDHFEGAWRFQALTDEACKVILDLEFAIRGGLLSMAASGLLERVTGNLVDSVVRRANEVYGA